MPPIWSIRPDWRGLDTGEIVFDAERDIGVVFVGLLLEEAIGVLTALLGVAQRGEITPLDEGCVIGTKPQRKHLGKGH